MKAIKWIARVPLVLLGLLLSTWSVLSVHYSALPWGWMRTLLAALVGLVILAAWIRSRAWTPSS